MDLYCFSKTVISPAEFANYKCTHKTESNCSLSFVSPQFSDIHRNNVQYIPSCK